MYGMKVESSWGEDYMITAMVQRNSIGLFGPGKVDVVRFSSSCCTAFAKTADELEYLRNELNHSTFYECGNVYLVK